MSDDPEYTVADEDGYARTYDEDEGILIRVGDVRAVLDVATMSMNFASGFLDEEQVEALRKVASQLGMDPLLATPHNFVCKYGGTHQWQPMSLGGTPPALPPTAAQELLERLEAHKKVVLEDGDRSVEALDALKAVEMEVHEARQAARESRSPWVQPPHTPRRPLDICPLCHHTRPTPAVWSSGTGPYRLELVIHPERPPTDRPPLDGVLTLYHAPSRGQDPNVGELVLDQRRVNPDNPEDPDDRLIWILWATDRVALSEPGQPLTWISPPGRVSHPVVSRDQPKAPEEEL